MVDASGGLRPDWNRFSAGLDSLGPGGLADRADHVRRALRENGVTYNVYGAPQGPDRPWELDPLPLLIASSEWKALAGAVSQRARLLDRIAADVYGPQELLRRGLLPPELVGGHPGFLFPCHGLKPPRDTFLHLYAVHLARSSGGEWLALADRTQGPSGAGYAIENRLIIARTLPEEFQNLYVERLASFFMRLRESLWSLSPRAVDNPRVVLLSPGPRSNTYFEDAYLSRYLGFTLVEGGDLTVRGAEVFLKTLGGLVRVDVILRRLADNECDPLELNPQGWSGVPGLVAAVRSGAVSVANTLGSGWLEAPVLMALLPRICEHLTGESLRLPSVPTWWCGDADGLAYVSAHLEQLVIRPAFTLRTSPPVVAADLNESERVQLLERIRRRPAMFVAQTNVTRSTVPVWSGTGLQSWHIGLRTFAVADDGDYRVLPGGLARASPNPSGLGASIAAGQTSKDVWVLSDRPVAPVTLITRPATAIALQRTQNDLPSRLAENVFWLGRLVERAEGEIRHLRSIVSRLANEPEAAIDQRSVLRFFTQALLHHDRVPDAVPVSATGSLWESLRGEILTFLFDEEHADSLAATLRCVRRNAATLRDRLSIDSWRFINQLDLADLYPWPHDQVRLDDLQLLLNRLLGILLAIAGLANENMTQGPVWRFFDLGRRLERAAGMLRLVERTLVRSDLTLSIVLELLLEIYDSTMTYCSRYFTSLQLTPVLDLLVFDESNPRGLAFQVSAIASHIRKLRSIGGRGPEPFEREWMFDVQHSLRLVSADDLSEVGVHDARPLLAGFVASFRARIQSLYEHVDAVYFTHAAPTRQLGAAQGSEQS